MNFVTNFLSDVLTDCYHYILPEYRDAEKLRNTRELDARDVNPFFSSPQSRLPFPLKYVTKPLAKPEHVDFGDRKIFYVSDGEDLGFKYRFNLPNHQEFKIDKTTGMKQSTPDTLASSKLL